MIRRLLAERAGQGCALACPMASAVPAAAPGDVDLCA
jgi:hypothetical protein